MVIVDYKYGKTVSYKPGVLRDFIPGLALLTTAIKESEYSHENFHKINWSSRDAMETWNVHVQVISRYMKWKWSETGYLYPAHISNKYK